MKPQDGDRQERQDQVTDQRQVPVIDPSVDDEPYELRVGKVHGIGGEHAGHAPRSQQGVRAKVGIAAEESPRLPAPYSLSK